MSKTKRGRCGAGGMRSETTGKSGDGSNTGNGEGGDTERQRSSKTAEERESAISLLAEAIEKHESRVKDRPANLDAESGRPDSRFFSKLDSSIKKNTAFVKKVKDWITVANRSALLKEMNALNLRKYISEVVVAISEAKIKQADLPVAVELCTLLHQRYAEFSRQLYEMLFHAFSIGKDRNIDDLDSNRFRSCIRLIGELLVTGVFGNPKPLYLLLEGALKKDVEAFTYVQTVVQLTRNCGEELFGLVARKRKGLFKKYHLEYAPTVVVKPDHAAKFRMLFDNYYKGLSELVVKQYKKARNMERDQNQRMLTKGEVNDAATERYQNHMKVCEKLLGLCESLADALDCDVPDLPEADVIDEAGIEIFAPGSHQALDEDSVWETEEARAFYMSLADLKVSVPSIVLFGDKKKEPKEDEKPSEEEKKGEEEDIGESTAEELALLEGCEADDVADDERDDQGAITSPAQGDGKDGGGGTTNPGLDNLVMQLPVSMNRQRIDQLTMDFCLLGSKSNRKILVQTLLGVPASRPDLVPFYARMIATLCPVMPDVLEAVTAQLQSEFRMYRRRIAHVHVDRNVRNIRFIAELTKFDIVPKKKALDYLQVLLKNFQQNNVEAACVFLEVCGRLLYRTKVSHIRTKVLVDQMIRKKQSQNLDDRYISMIENAFYACNPPERSTIERPKAPPMHQYIKHVLYTLLGSAEDFSAQHVVQLLRRLPWDSDKGIKEFAVNCMIASWNLKHGLLGHLASVVVKLSRHQSFVRVMVVDGVLEEIRLGMEVNKVQFSNRRYQSARFLCELYNYRLFDNSVVFDTLYLLITFGHMVHMYTPSHPPPPSPIDPPDDFFRIRLVCVILEECAKYFEGGATRRKLDYFLLYFQRYILSKETLPLLIEYLVEDTLKLIRPDITIFKTYSEAFEAVQKVEHELQQKYVLNEGRNTADEEVSEDSAEESGDDDDDDDDDDDNDDDDHMDEVADDYNANKGHRWLDEEEEVRLVREEEARQKQEENEEFDRLMNEFVVSSLESARRSQQTNTMKGLDAVAPKAQSRHDSSTASAGDAITSKNEGKTFQVLTRSKNRQNALKSIVIPTEVKLAHNLDQQQALELKEKEQMKRLVLELEDEMQQQEELDAKGLGARTRWDRKMQRQEQLQAEQMPPDMWEM